MDSVGDITTTLADKHADMGKTVSGFSRRCLKLVENAAQGYFPLVRANFRDHSGSAHRTQVGKIHVKKRRSDARYVNPQGRNGVRRWSVDCSPEHSLHPKEHSMVEQPANTFRSGDGSRTWIYDLGGKR